MEVCALGDRCWLSSYPNSLESDGLNHTYFKLSFLKIPNKNDKTQFDTA